MGPLSSGAGVKRRARWRWWHLAGIPGMNREGWLTAALSALRPKFRKAGLPIPRGTRVACSWPSKGAIAKRARSRNDAETWYFANGAPEIAISPTLGQNDVEVLGALAHEMVHAALGHKIDHRFAAFREACEKIGLTRGRLCARRPGPELRAELEKLSRRLGPYPHTGVVFKN